MPMFESPRVGGRVVAHYDGTDDNDEVVIAIRSVTFDTGIARETFTYDEIRQAAKSGVNLFISGTVVAPNQFLRDFVSSTTITRKIEELNTMDWSDAFQRFVLDPE